MKPFLKATSWLVLVSVVSAGSPAFAVDLLDTAEHIFYKPGDQTRMGIEIELKGLSPREVAEEFRSKMGGKIVTEQEDTKTNVIGHDKEGFPIYDTRKTEYFVIKGSRIGDVILKPDYNQITDTFNADQEKNIVTEIVTPPIRMPEVEKLDQLLTHLQKKGAQGTYPNGLPNPRAKKDTSNPVSTQVNVEWMEGKRENMKPADLVNLMRSYVRPEHREQIDAHLNVPSSRKPYIEVFSDGFMKKLLDPNYNPDFRQLYDDYIYRQSLERLSTQTEFDSPPTPEQKKLIAKGKNAWTMPIEEAKKTLIALGELAVVPKVVKQNPLRVSSLLMYLFPNDHMSRLYDATGWAKGRPLIEFREWNNTFSAVSEAKQALGLVEAAKKYGYYDHDKLLASLSTMDEKAIQDLRESVNKSHREGKSVFRYYLGDPKSVDRTDYQDQTKHYKTGVVGFLPYGSYGQAPVRIPGESVVMHRRPQHGNSVVGLYNPGLINSQIAQAMENKFTEAAVWQKYAPGVMPETRSLESYNREVQKPEKLVQKLNRQFPDGWVMKGVWDLGSEKDIITDQTDVIGALKSYDPAAFEKRKAALQKKYAGLKDAAPEYIQSELKKDPGYKGWRIAQMLSKPELVIVQKKVAIDREFRVEVISGKVLGAGTTIDRFKYMYESGVDGLSMKDYVPPSKNAAKKVEQFAQEAVDRLPPELRGMPFGMDIALLKDGSLAMIESNPGGNSNFLYEEHKESVIELGKFLENYPDAVKSGAIPAKVARGMTPEEQMEFLKKFFRENKINPEKQYPGIVFHKNRIEDAEFRRAEPQTEEYAIVAKKLAPAPDSTRQRSARASSASAANAARPLELALRTEEVQKPHETVTVDQARMAVASRVKALSAGRSARDFRLETVDVRFDESLPAGIEAQTRLTADRDAVLSFRTDQNGRISREALDEELRHLDQIRKNPEKILTRTSEDPGQLAQMEAQIKAARGVRASEPHVSAAGKAAVGTGLAQSLMSALMNYDLKDRGLDDQGIYHFAQGIGDADNVMDLAIRKPIQSRSLQLARGGLGLTAKGLGIYGAGMSAVQLRQALAEGDTAAATSAGVKTTVLGGSVLRQFAKPLAKTLVTEGGAAVARRAGASGAAKVLGTVTGPVGLTALAVGDIGAMAVEWRAAAYYGSIEKIFAEPQFETLRFGTDFQKSVMTAQGIQGSLKAIQTNVDKDERARETRFKLEGRALAEGLAIREILGLSIEPLTGDQPAALAQHFKASAAFNFLATNVPPSIVQMCKSGELQCKTKVMRQVGAGGLGGVGSVGSSPNEEEVIDYQLAMADFILKQKAKAKVKFEKEWKEALASGRADPDWLAFIQEKEKLEREYSARLRKEEQPKEGQSPLQKEYSRRIYETYGRTMRSAQISDAMFEHAGIGPHVTPTEKKTLREAVRKATVDGKVSPPALKSLESELVSIETSVISRRTGLSPDQIRNQPVAARLAARKLAFREGMAAEGIDVEKLPSGVRDTVDQILKEKLEIEAKTGPFEERPADDQQKITQANLQLEALLYGIQMSQKEPPITEARVEDHARRFLGAGSTAHQVADAPAKAVEQLERALKPGEQEGHEDPREFLQRSRLRGATETHVSGKPAKAGAASTAR